MELAVRPDDRARHLRRRRADPGRGRGVPPLGHPDPAVRPDGHRGHGALGSAGLRRRLPRDALRVRQSRREPRSVRRPRQFDPARAPGVANLGFGFGQHLCLGAALARMETRVLFEELAARRRPTPKPVRPCTSRPASSAAPLRPVRLPLTTIRPGVCHGGDDDAADDLTGDHRGKRIVHVLECDGGRHHVRQVERSRLDERDQLREVATTRAEPKFEPSRRFSS